MDIIIIYLLLLAIFVPIIIYFSLRTLKALRVKKIREIDEPFEDKTYNIINSTKAISNILKSRGYDTSPADALLVKAEEEYKAENYTDAYSLALNAKRILEKIKASTPESVMTSQKNETSPSTIDKELSYILEDKDEEKKENEEEYYSPSYIIRQKYPENYLQSKFAISVVASKIEHISDENIRNVAMLYYERARKEFEDENYTNALKYAIKCRKIIDGECSPEEHIEEIATDIYESSTRDSESYASTKQECPSCGAPIEKEDIYCWQCGIKLELRCSKCGREVRAEDIFCRKCGAKLK